MSHEETAILPCAFDEEECNVGAVGRVHDANDEGFASAYVCPNHLDWAHAWVREWTGEDGRFTEVPPARSGSGGADRG